MKLVEIFETIPDFRNEKYISYKLSEILIISLCAVLSGADDCEEISEYGREKEKFLCQFLELENGIPSHDTFNRVFKSMESQYFEKCLIDWSKEIISELEGLQINIDGKVLRATGKRGKKTAAICIVNAWLSEHCLCLGQTKVSKKSNEKTAIPQLIEAIDITGALVSIDAMGCDKNIASLICSHQGNYLLALKKNQKGLYEEIHDWMNHHYLKMDKFEQTDYVGGRIERRTTFVTNQLTFIDETQKWENSRSVIMMKSERIFKNGEEKNTSKTRFYISSVDAGAQFFGQRIRNHWSIENQLHWYLDVVFNEDRQRIRIGNAAENMAVLRKMGLQILLQNKGKKSLKTIRKKVAWNEKLLLDILENL